MPTRSKIMKRKIPKLTSDEQAEAFLEQDLSHLDFSQFKPTRFEFQKKTAQINMRVPKALLEAVKRRSAARGIPYTRFIREALEQGRFIAPKNRGERKNAALSNMSRNRRPSCLERPTFYYIRSLSRDARNAGPNQTRAAPTDCEEDSGKPRSGSWFSAPQLAAIHRTPATGASDLSLAGMAGSA